VGRILGFEKSTVYDRIKNGRLGAVRLDGAIRVPRSELVKYIAAATPVSA
jgi:excisionase family DNA binding protein